MTTITLNRNRNNEPLTNEQIQKVAPSAFAGQAHSSRSDRYTFVPTVEVIEGLRASGFVPVAASQSLSRIAGKELFTKHMIRFRAENQSMTQVGDTAVEAILINSHDGTSLYDLSLGAFRLACLNGMVVSKGLAESVKVRHSGNIIRQIVEATHNLIQMAPRVVEAIRQWKQIMLSAQEQMFLAEGALALRFDEQAPVSADRLLVSRRYADNGTDLWTVFNRIQEAVVRGGLKYIQPAQNMIEGYVPSRRNRTREVKGIDQNTKLNRELWSLAEKMAELKGGN